MQNKHMKFLDLDTLNNSVLTQDFLLDLRSSGQMWITTTRL